MLKKSKVYVARGLTLLLSSIVVCPTMAGPRVADFEVGAGAGRLRLSDLRGRFTVLQYLPTLDGAGVAAYMQEFGRRRIAPSHVTTEKK